MGFLKKKTEEPRKPVSPAPESPATPGIDYEKEYLEEQERLAKLWDAYEKQIAMIGDLEKENRALTEALQALSPHFRQGTDTMKLLEQADVSRETMEILRKVLKGN